MWLCVVFTVCLKPLRVLETQYLTNKRPTSVVGRLRNTRTDSIPEASSRPFINISIRMSGCAINLYRLAPFVHIILTAMCDRAPLSIYAGFPPIVCTL